LVSIAIRKFRSEFYARYFEGIARRSRFFLVEGWALLMTAGALPAAGCSSSGFVILNAVKNLPCARGRLAPIGATPAAGPGEHAKNESSRLINSFADGSDTGAEFFLRQKGLIVILGGAKNLC
jgi:hypothetical protein